MWAILVIWWWAAVLTSSPCCCRRVQGVMRVRCVVNATRTRRTCVATWSTNTCSCASIPARSAVAPSAARGTWSSTCWHTLTWHWNVAPVAGSLPQSATAMYIREKHINNKKAATNVVHWWGMMKMGCWGGSCHVLYSVGKDAFILPYANLSLQSEIQFYEIWTVLNKLATRLGIWVAMYPSWW